MTPSSRTWRLRGFTLVECMIVVLVIGILAALAFPRYNQSRNQVRVNQALQDVAAIQAAVENYRLQNAQSLPGSLADINMAGKLDPWGAAYVYYNIEANGKGGARKDHALNPLNTDFDVYSMGADGQSKSQITQKESLDDVIRASNGGFVGLASDF